MSRAFLDGALDHVVSLGMGDVGPGCDESLGLGADGVGGVRGDASVAEVRGVMGRVSEERQEGGEDREDAHGER